MLIACKPASYSSPVLDNKSCNFPCWNSIVPGKTTAKEVVQLLEKNPDVKPETIKESTAAWAGFDSIFWDFNNHEEGAIYLKNGIVHHIEFGPKLIRTLLYTKDHIDVKFSDALKEYGEPESVLTSTGVGDSFWTNLYILYPQKGIILLYSTLGMKPLWKEEITPDAPLLSITYFDPSAFQDFFDLNYFSIIGMTEDEITDHIHPWSGYGKIKEKYPIDAVDE